MRYAVRCAATVVALAGVSLPAQSATAPTVQFIQVAPDVKLEVLDWGGTGRPVVLLHGHGRTAHDFEGFAPKLAATNHVYAITLRGYGVSSRPPTGYTADRLADDVIAVMDSLRLVAPVLAGHSLSGEELSSIGSRHPERVGGLVYLDAAGQYSFFDAEGSEGRDYIDPNEVKRGLDQLFQAATQGNSEEMHRLITRLLNADLPALDQTLRHLEKRTPPTTSNPPRNVIMQLRPGAELQIFEGQQRYTAVRAPVLAIYALHGDSSEVSDWRAGRRHELVALKRAAPTARTLLLPGASHDVFNSNASDVLREMGAFMATLPAPAPAARGAQ